MFKRPKIKCIGKYLDYENPIINNKRCNPASFYFIEGNVMFLFDYSPEDYEYFTNQYPDFFKENILKEIVLCFSFNEMKYYDTNNDLTYESCVNRFITDVYMPKADKHTELRVIYNMPVLVSEYQPPYADYIQMFVEKVYPVYRHHDNPNGDIIVKIEDISNQPYSNFIETNNGRILIIPNQSLVKYSMISYTIWEESDAGWMCLFHYTGKSGLITQETINFLIENPKCKLIFYINHFYLNHIDLPDDIASTAEIIKNSLDDIPNDIIFLGFTNPQEAIYCDDIW